MFVCVCVCLCVGDELLEAPGEFLAMVWQNDPKVEHHVNVTSKEVLVSVKCALGKGSLTI